MRTKPVLCVDFDGVLHSLVADEPVPGAMAFLHRTVDRFEVNVYSSRSHQVGGIEAMQVWINEHAAKQLGHSAAAHIISNIKFPRHKPNAMLYLDDRAITFNGAFPTIEQLFAFKPWYKR